MILIDESKRYYKGNTHTHTTISDGRLSPDEVAALYRSMGYDFIVQSDHWKVSPEREDHGLLVMSGVEIDVYPPRQTAHIVGVGVTGRVTDGLSRQSGAQQAIDQINADGGCAILAHPAWSLNTPDFMSGLHGLSGIEIYNTFSGTPWNAERADSSSLIDVAATWGQLLPLVAADDSHRYAGEAGRSFVMVQAEELNSRSIVSAMKAGRYYATQGPRILQAELAGDTLYLRFTPASRVVFYSNLPWVADRCRMGAGMTEAEYRLNADRGETFVRCEITDEQGARAWLSPVAVR